MTDADEFDSIIGTDDTLYNPSYLCTLSIAQAMSLANERHLYASARSAFWNRYFDAIEKAGKHITFMDIYAAFSILDCE